MADRADRAVAGARRGIPVVWAEAALVVVAFAVLCLVVLSVAPQSAEPDDGAYRASIVAMNSVSPRIPNPRFTRPQHGRAACTGV